MALGFAVGARGADHNRSGAYEVDFSDKADRRHATLDSVQPRHRDRGPGRADGLADPVQVPARRVHGLLRRGRRHAARVTGWDVTADELRETARRIVAAKRQFNMRAGWTPAEDTLPERFLDAALPDDPAAVLTRERLDELVDEYHRQRGWDALSAPLG